MSTANFFPVPGRASRNRCESSPVNDTFSPVRTPVHRRTTDEILLKKHIQCTRLWRLISLSRHSPPLTGSLSILNLLSLAHSIEDHLEVICDNYVTQGPRENHSIKEIGKLISFYRAPKLLNKQFKRSSISLYHQLLSPIESLLNPESHNRFSILHIDEICNSSMLNQSSTNRFSSVPTSSKISTDKPHIFTVNDTSVSALSKLILDQLNKDKEQATSSNPTIEHQDKLTTNPDPHKDDIRQRMWLNLIRHRGIVSDMTTVKFFHFFGAALREADSTLAALREADSTLAALREADSTLSFLPFQASKQHYSPLMTHKHITSVTENQLYQFYKPFYRKQVYSLSGYFHISTQLSFPELMSLP
jgi:hypothetical protein